MAHNGTPLVEGEIVFDADVPAFSGATVHVYLENTGRMDAPAPVIAEHIEHNAAYNGRAIPFKIFGNMPPADEHYSLRVHISRDGSADIKKGDFINTQSYPVLTHDHPKSLKVQVKKI